MADLLEHLVDVADGGGPAVSSSESEVKVKVDVALFGIFPHIKKRGNFEANVFALRKNVHQYGRL